MLAEMAGEQRDRAGVRIAQATLHLPEGAPQRAVDVLVPVIERRERRPRSRQACVVSKTRATGLRPSRESRSLRLAPATAGRAATPWPSSVSRHHAICVLRGRRLVATAGGARERPSGCRASDPAPRAFALVAFAVGAARHWPEQATLVTCAASESRKA